MHILRSTHWCLEVKINCQIRKAHIVKRQDTVNHELDQFERTCGRSYIYRITDAASSDSDACTTGIFIFRSDFTNNHGVESFLSSVTKDIFKSNDAEIVCDLNALVLGSL